MERRTNADGQELMLFKTFTGCTDGVRLGAKLPKETAQQLAYTHIQAD